MSKKAILVAIVLILFVAVAALAVWFLVGRNKTGDTVTDVEGPPNAPLPTIMGTPTPYDPSAGGGGGEPESSPTPEIMGTVQAGAGELGFDLEAPPSFDELLEKYPELGELLQNLDLTDLDEAKLEMLYNQLLALYEEEGFDGLHQFMLESGILDALNLDSAYLDFVLAYEDGGPEAAAELARQRGLVTDDDELRIVLILDTDDAEDISDVETQLNQILGAHILQQYGNEIEVGVPLERLMEMDSSQEALARLVALAHVEHVIGVRTPEMLAPGMPLSQPEGPGVTGADAWHAAGFTGAGVRVGIIDPGGFGGYQGLLGGQLPSTVNLADYQDAATLNAQANRHGTACAEIVHAMARDAELYLVFAQTSIELKRAVDWLLAEGVNIISYSGGSGVGAMDGTGYLADRVRDATRRGVLWVNSSGNSAKSHLSMTFTDADGDGWHDFSYGSSGNPDELLDFTYTGAPVTFGLNWDDSWGGGASENYDFFIYAPSADGSGFERVDGCGGWDDQNGEAADYPNEHWSGHLTVGQNYGLAIRGTNISRPGQLNLFGDQTDFQHWVLEGSVTTPGDAAESLTVGAAYCSRSGATINCSLADYSSQGPTRDGRLKPEIVGPTGVSVASYAGAFHGTSASAPHVAGAAALVWSAYPEASWNDVRDYLIRNAVTVLSPRPNMQTGFGRLALPAPPSTEVSPPPGAPEAAIQNIWVEHNYYAAGIKGMMIHVAFDINHFQGQQGTVIAKFYNQATGAALVDHNGDYADGSGEVAVWQGFEPIYEYTTFSNLALFMPYNELELAAGEYWLDFRVGVLNNDGWQSLAESDPVAFTYQKSEPVHPSASITNIRIDHNVTRDGVMGMDIYVSFDIANYRDREGMAAAYFYFGDESNRPLRDFNGQYRDAAGNVSVGRYFSPVYDNTTFTDLLLFMPYSELHMAPGSYDLKFYVAIWNTEEWLELTSSGWQYFYFSTD